jgi:MFS family permease
MSIAAVPSGTAGRAVGKDEFKVIAASSVGTIFEWFDFYLYGSLAVIISRKFFSGVDETSAFVLALLAFAAGFAVRPFGAVVFGFVGDIFGRKLTFLITLTLMGAATFAVGLLPTYQQIGVAAPWILVVLRMLQGLSVGGVYGGAATYVAEHVDAARRGFYTSWIQITPTVGMALSLIAIFGTRTYLGEETFGTWGWRLPFLFAGVLVGVAIWIQLELAESPVYLQMKASRRSSARPWADAFGNWKNLRLMLIALFGATIGQAAVWYTAQFYALFFIERVLKVDGAQTNLLVAAALFISTPLYIFSGWLSDRIGRKPVLLGALLLAVFTYMPLYRALTQAANPALARAVATSPVRVYADLQECSFQFDLIGKARFDTSCDIVRSYLTRTGVTYDSIKAPPGTPAELRVGQVTLKGFSGERMSSSDLAAQRSAWERQASAIVSAAGYPLTADPAKINRPVVILILLGMMAIAAMSYGPVAALLTELFPARIRYTSMSLPYHIGNGWFGGFLPTVAFAIVAATGNIFSGLWYPLTLAASTFLVGIAFLPETRGTDIHA